MPMLMAIVLAVAGWHADFVEVGTNEFDTLIGRANASTTGLSVEALAIYQDRLPNPPLVQKVNAAIVSNRRARMGDSLDFYFVKPNDIRTHNLSDNIRGMGSVSKPNPGLLTLLKPLGLERLVTHVRVPTLTFARLINLTGVSSIAYLKVDVEGNEVDVLGDDGGVRSFRTCVCIRSHPQSKAANARRALLVHAHAKQHAL